MLYFFSIGSKNSSFISVSKYPGQIAFTNTSHAHDVVQTISASRAPHVLVTGDGRESWVVGEM